ITHTKETCLSYVKTFEGSPNCFWAVHDGTTGELIGTMTAYIDTTNRAADIGIMIGHPRARGCGLGQSAWGLAMRYLFEVAQLDKVTGGCLSSNQAMVKIFEFWQMTLQRETMEPYLVPDELQKVLHYEMLRQNWLSSPRHSLDP